MFLSFELMTNAVTSHVFTLLGIRVPVLSLRGNIIEYHGNLFFVITCLAVICTTVLVINNGVLKTSQLRRVLERKK